MPLEAVIPVFDLIGMLGFLIAMVIAVQNYRSAEFEQVFWLGYVLTATLGALWLGLVALEWLGIQRVLLDVFSTSLQAVVIGVFAIGAIGSRAIVEDLKASHVETVRQHHETKVARNRAESRKRELEQTQDLLAEAEQMANIGGWELDCETDEIRLTDGIRDVFGTAKEAISNLSSVLELFHPDDRETLREAIDECRQTGIAYELELRIITKDGEERWVQTRGARIDDGDGRKLRGVIQNISSRKEREQRLMVLNRILRHNLRNKVTIISGYAEQLESDLTRLDGPASTIRQDVRETIESIASSTVDLDNDLAILQQLLDEIEQFPTAKAQDNVENILESSGELSSLSTKANQFQRAVNTDSVRERVDVGPLIDRLIATYVEAYPDATIERLGTDVEIRGNPDGIRLAIGELIENAIIHNDHSRVRVVVEIARSSPERAEIRVLDNGPGIPAMERDVLSNGKETPLLHGSGLGLWTVNWITTRFGASIEIADNEPTGTIVTLLFPLGITD